MSPQSIEADCINFCQRLLHNWRLSLTYRTSAPQKRAPGQKLPRDNRTIAVGRLSIVPPSPLHSTALYRSPPGSTHRPHASVLSQRRLPTECRLPSLAPQSYRAAPPGPYMAPPSSQSAPAGRRRSTNQRAAPLGRPERGHPCSSGGGSGAPPGRGRGFSALCPPLPRSPHRARVAPRLRLIDAGRCREERRHGVRL